MQKKDRKPKRQAKQRPKYRGPVNSPDLHGYARRSESLRLLGFRSYADYLASPLWQSIRSRVMRLAHGACQNCKTNPPNEVHHRHYSIEVMSGYSIQSLAALCRNCHKNAEFDGGTKTSLGTANKRLKESQRKANPLDYCWVIPDALLQKRRDQRRAQQDAELKSKRRKKPASGTTQRKG